MRIQLRGIEVNLKSTSVYYLSLLVGLLSLISSAQATTPSLDCTPVVYAFRHAEDSNNPVTPFPCLPGSRINCTTALKPVGKGHANLYVEMITSLEMKKDFCPVSFVFSINPIKPDGFGGTTNPFFTGKPLSKAVMNLDPIVEIAGDIIDEKLTVVSPQVLHDKLIGIAKSGASAALFWTSDGLHDLGVALGTDIIPVKTPSVSPPRNAAYIFKYNGSDTFLPPAKPDEYVQCFNYATGGRDADNFTNKFYCGFGPNGNLSIPESDLDKLHGRICAPDDPDFKKITTPPNYYGYCASPPTGSAP
jgi:hypothetical protein